MNAHDSKFEEAALVTLLMSYGYRNVRMLDETYWAGTFRFMYTHAIVVGFRESVVGYEDRWCYATEEAAQKALEAWDGKYWPYSRRQDGRVSSGVSEPSGWHRHPMSGRRFSETGEMYIAR